MTASFFAIYGMDRCFGKHPTRTFLREVRATWLDGVAVGVLAVAGVVAVILTLAH